MFLLVPAGLLGVGFEPRTDPNTVQFTTYSMNLSPNQKNLHTIMSGVFFSPERDMSIRTCFIIIKITKMAHSW
jgi:hypothetical protein